MFQKDVSYVVVLVVVSLSLTGCFGGSRSHTVSGEVVPENGHGIAGVEIVVTGGKRLVTTTDDGGEYVFTGLTDICTLVPFLDGYTCEPTQITVTKERNNTNFIETAIPVEEFNLVLENGVGGRDYAAGTAVTISANAPEESGKAFDKWITSGGESFGNVYAETTTFTIPNSDVTVTATYKDATMADYFEFDLQHRYHSEISHERQIW